MTTPVLDFVEIVEKPEVNALHVCPHWKGVDRPYTGGYGVPIQHRALANRLKVAIESGKLWLEEPKIATDIYGKTYVNAGLKIRMRCLNADLKSLGF